MRHYLKHLAVAGAAALVAMATAASVFATGSGLDGAGVRIDSDAPAATCSKLKASEVAWVTLNDDGEIEDQVDSYPSETTLITPLFEYNCVPKKITVVTVFTLDGEPVFTDKETLKATKSRGIYAYSLGTEDETALPEGEWGVEFYNSKTLLTSGTIVVGDGGGGEVPEGETVTVQGVVRDKKTKKPIKAAVILVLNPGVTVEEWVDGGQEDEAVFTAGKTDSKGQFVLESELERDVEYSLIVVAKGYKPIGYDGFVVTEDDPDPLDLNIAMTK